MKVMDEVNTFFTEHIAPPHRITAIQKQEDGDGWKALVEVIEEKDYMKRYGNDEMIGLYEVFLNKNLSVAGFSRISLRYRSDLEQQAE